MEEQFTHIATIVFHHDYFENGRFNSLQTGISEDSQKQLFQRLGILIKPITGGVHIFTSKIALLQAQQEAHPILLELHNTDPYFVNYTIIPRGVGATTSINFDNLKVKSTPDTTQNKLQQLNYLGVLEHEQSQRKPMGIIALYPNALYSHFIQDNSTVNYTIDFEVRKTHWKYICMLTSTRTFFDLRIMNSRKEENFKRSEDIDGNIVFTSTHAMALSEKGNEVYSLVGKRLEVTEDHRIIISPLPLPSIAQVFSDDDTRSDKLYSHIYLYI